MKTTFFALTVSVLTTIFPMNALAGGPPEIQISGKGVTSANLALSNSQSSSVVSDFSDSTLMLGLRQKLYSDWRSSMVMGIQLPDADSGLGDIFLSQTFLQLEDQYQEIKIGRSNARTSLVTFPTLRDDDALNFNYVLNPFSSGQNTQDNQYANVLEYRRVFNQRWWIGVHGENFIDFQNPNQFSLNALGAAFEYRVPPAQIWNREILQYAGLSYYNFLTEADGNFNLFTTSLQKIAAGLRLNVFPDPVHFVDFRAQSIYNLGLGSIESINDYNDYTRANALATFANIRYVYRRLERPLIQTNLGVGSRIFPNNNSTEWTVLANTFYRIGENLDLGLQYRFVSSQGEVRDLRGGDEHRLQVALVYNFDVQFFNQFDDRGSLLNLEHSYLK